MLLDAKADVNPPVGRLVLASACREFKADVVQLLLDAGAPTEVGDGAAVDLVVDEECSEEEIRDKIAVLNVLLDADAMLHGKAIAAAMAASENARPGAVVRAVIAKYPEILRDIEAESLLGEAVSMRKADVVEALVDAGASVADVDGDTPLVVQLLMDMKTAEDVHPATTRRILKVLLAAGADPLARDRRGMTVLMLALRGDRSYLRNRWIHYDLPDSVRSILIGDILEAVLERGETYSSLACFRDGDTGWETDSEQEDEDEDEYGYADEDEDMFHFGDDYGEDSEDSFMYVDDED
jgi:ankyrin repeat protein